MGMHCICINFKFHGFLKNHENMMPLKFALYCIFFPLVNCLGSWYRHQFPGICSHHWLAHCDKVCQWTHHSSECSGGDLGGEGEAESGLQSHSHHQFNPTHSTSQVCPSSSLAVQQTRAFILAREDSRSSDYFIVLDTIKSSICFQKAVADGWIKVL